MRKTLISINTNASDIIPEKKKKEKKKREKKKKKNHV